MHAADKKERQICMTLIGQSYWSIKSNKINEPIIIIIIIIIVDVLIKITYSLIVPHIIMNAHE